METPDNEKSDGTPGDILLGEYLKQKRLERNYSLEKLSQKTKISVNILKSLEANDLNNLPSAAYIKGFVTSYAKVLSIPVSEAITRMEHTYQTLTGKPFPALNHTKAFGSLTPVRESSAAERAEKALENKQAEVSPHDVITSSDSLMESTKSVLPVAVFACIVLLFIGGYKLITSVVEGEVNSQKTKDLGPRIEPSSALVHPKVAPKPPETQPATTPPAETTGTAGTTAAPTGAQGQPTTVVAPPVEPKPEEKKPAPVIERNFPPVNFTKIKGKLFSVVSEAPENNDPELLPEAIKAKVNPALQNVYIRATTGDTWMSYKIEGKPIKGVIISKGNDLFLQGNEIRIFLGNVQVTKIFYNNYLIETPTKSGVKSLVFPEENSSKYLMPLFPRAKDDIFYTAEEYLKRQKLEEEELGKKEE